MMTSREAAFKAVTAYKNSGAWSEIYLDNLFKAESISGRDAALANNIALGTIQNFYFLDYCISEYCKTPIKKLHPVVHTILQISAYQILFLSRVPQSAAVNEGVDLCKKYAFTKASGLVNAVLRRISENRASLFQVRADSLESFLSIRYSHPMWLVDELIKTIGPNETEQFLATNNTPADITVQTNFLKTTDKSVADRFSDLGIDFDQDPRIQGSFHIRGTGRLDSIDIFSEGLIYVQDMSAYASVMASEPKPGMRVLDVCAAPGGKSVSCGILMNNEGSIISCDIHDKKLGRILDNASRMGIGIIETRQADGRVFIPEYESSFDIVIADVPCSGFGVIRKKPEIRYKTDEDTAGLCNVQLDILKNASRYVRPGGILIYSTCTVLKRENEDIIFEFLKHDDSFILDSFSVGNFVNSNSGYVTIWPQRTGTDGFFISKLRRKT